MSDIRVKLTGRVFFEVDPTVAALFLEAFPESFQQVQRMQPKPLVHSWGVGMSRLGEFAVLQLTTGTKEIVPYNGKAENAAKFYEQNYRHCLPIPQDVLAHYAILARAQGSAARTESEINNPPAEPTGQLWKYPSNR